MTEAFIPAQGAGEGAVQVRRTERRRWSGILSCILLSPHSKRSIYRAERREDADRYGEKIAISNALQQMERRGLIARTADGWIATSAGRVAYANEEFD